MAAISPAVVTSALALGGDVAPVAEHRDAVGDLEHLVEAVADEQHGHALVPQLAHLPEQALDLVGRQRGRGLVHDQHPDVERDGLGDLDGLLGGDGQARRRHAGVEVDVEAGQQGLGVRAHPPPAHDPALVTVADEDVLGHAEVGEDQRLLVDGGDAPALGVGRAARGRGLAVDQDLAVVGRVDAGHDLDQRRLAGPVLADQRVHLAPPQLERHVVEGTGGPEALGDAPHGEHDILGMHHQSPPTRRRSTLLFLTSTNTAAQGSCSGGGARTRPPLSFPTAVHTVRRVRGPPGAAAREDSVIDTEPSVTPATRRARSSAA